MSPITEPARYGRCDHALRLRSLWIAWLLAMLFHVDLGLMPLFHGVSPEIHSHVNPAKLPLVYGAMLGYFLVPLVAIILIAYAASDPEHVQAWQPWRRIHFWLSIAYTVTNALHLIADIAVPDARADQIVLMVGLVVLGLLINAEAWQWWREGRSLHTIARPAASNTPSNSTELR